jgi:hypothetical protein
MEYTTIKYLRKFTDRSLAKVQGLLKIDSPDEIEKIRENYFDKTSIDNHKLKGTRICNIENLFSGSIYLIEYLHGYGYSGIQDFESDLGFEENYIKGY